MREILSTVRGGPNAADQTAAQNTADHRVPAEGGPSGQHAFGLPAVLYHSWLWGDWVEGALFFTLRHQLLWKIVADLRPAASVWPFCMSCLS